MSAIASQSRRQNTPRGANIRIRRSPTTKLSTYDAAARTVEAVLSTGVAVERWGFVEELVISPTAVNVDRVNAGLCLLLDNHNARDRSAILGVVESARVDGARLVGRIRFADTPSGREVEGMVARGEVMGLSIGYQPTGRQTISRNGNEVELITSWTLMEVSLASIPADSSARFRSIDNNEPKWISTMEPEELILDGSPETQARNESDAVIAADRSRVRTIYDVAARAGISDVDRDAAIQDGTSADSFRARAFDAMVARTPATSSIRSTGADANLTRAEAVTGALVARMSGSAPEGPSREFMNLSLVEMGEAVTGSIPRRGWGRAPLSERLDSVMQRSYHSTSDFPVLLGTAINRVLEMGYAAAASPLIGLAREREVDDFRPVSLVRLGAFDGLEKVGQGGEVKYGSRAEAEQAAYGIGTFARIFSISRQALINDDLNAFGDVALQLGKAAAFTVADQMAAILSANSGNGANLADGGPLYGSGPTRANKAATGGAVSLATLSEARQALRTMKDVNGKTPINVQIRHLLVGPEKETEAEQILAEINATKTGDVNPFGGRLQLHVEPRLPGSAWRAFADPLSVPVLEVLYLRGRKVPQVDQKEGWSTLGMEWRVVLDFGAGAFDHRGTYLNPGT